MLNYRTGLSLVLAVALAACMCEAGVRDLRNKYRSLVGQEGGLISTGGGSAAAAASASSAGVSSSVAATAAAAGYGHQAGSGRVPVGGVPFVSHQQPHHPRHHHQYQQEQVPQYYQPQVPYARSPAPYRPVVMSQQPQYAPPPYYGTDGGLIEEPLPAQYAAAYGAQQQQPFYGRPAAQYAQPQQYQYAMPHQRHHKHPHHQQQQQHYPEPQRFVSRIPAAYGNHQQGGAATSSAAAAVGGGAAAAASSAAGSTGGHVVGNSGAASAAAAATAASTAQGYYQAAPAHDRRTVDEEVMSEHYSEPESVQHYEAQAGTFAGNGGGAGGSFEQGSYVRDTESVENHEDGREDGDHYYQAQAYGKTKDVNNHVAYTNDDEDIVHTPNMFRKKKSNTNFVSNFNKQHRETGSGVTAHDKHSASYNKNSKKLKENVDQRYSKGAEGMVQTKAFDSHTDVDDEDEEAMDTRGLGNFVGVDGVLHGRRAQPNNPAAAAAAAASASFQSGR